MYRANNNLLMLVPQNIPIVLYLSYVIFNQPIVSILDAWKFLSQNE